MQLYVSRGIELTASEGIKTPAHSLHPHTHPGERPCAAVTKMSSTLVAILSQSPSLRIISHFVGGNTCNNNTGESHYFSQTCTSQIYYQLTHDLTRGSYICCDQRWPIQRVALTTMDSTLPANWQPQWECLLCPVQIGHPCPVFFLQGICYATLLPSCSGEL